MAQESDVSLIAQIVMWVIGGIVTALSALVTWVFSKLGSLQRQIDRAALDGERRFALRTDVDELRKHVDGRFDRLEDAAEQSRNQILAEIRERRRAARG